MNATISWGAHGRGQRSRISFPRDFPIPSPSDNATTRCIGNSLFLSISNVNANIYVIYPVAANCTLLCLFALAFEYIDSPRYIYSKRSSYIIWCIRSGALQYNYSPPNCHCIRAARGRYISSPIRETSASFTNTVWAYLASCSSACIVSVSNGAGWAVWRSNRSAMRPEGLVPPVAAHMPLVASSDMSSVHGRGIIQISNGFISADICIVSVSPDLHYINWSPTVM